MISSPLLRPPSSVLRPPPSVLQSLFSPVRVCMMGNGNLQLYSVMNFPCRIVPVALTFSVLGGLISFSAVAQDASCANFWVNPSTGESECLGPDASVPEAPAASGASVPAGAAQVPSPTSQSPTPPATGGDFTRSFVNACSQMDLPGFAKDKQRSFCTCAAGGVQRLPPEKLASLRGASFAQLQGDPVFLNIATACMSHLL